MHRKNCVPRTVSHKLLLALVLGCVSAGAAAAQEALLPPKRAALVVPINGTKVLGPMASKKNLKNVTNQDPNVARVSARPEDPRTVLVTGLRSGSTRITLVDVDGAQEEFDVMVQTDVEHLRKILRQVVPTANVELIPASEGSIVLTGTVERAEDVDIILKTTAGVGGYPPALIINAMRVGGVVQVQLCVTIARVNRTLMRNFGFNFLLNDANTFFGSTVGNIIPQPPAVGFGAPVGPAVPGFNPQSLVSPPGVANIFGGVIHPNSGFLGFLQALEGEGVAKVLAEPRLVTLSGQPANFVSGGETPVVATSVGSTSVTYKQFGTVVRFLPIVLGNGKIHLEVEPEVSQQGAPVVAPGIVVPTFATDRVRTTVELEDGQTFAIGGLIQRTVNGSTTKVPILGQIPFLGALFSTKTFDEVETELVILVTPHLVDPMDCHQLPKLLPGQETRSPDDFELFLEGILEAPRGPREVFPNCQYKPAWQNDPTAGQFPCGGNTGGGHCGRSGCGNGGCGNGSCGNGSCGNGGCGTGNCGGPGCTLAAPASGCPTCALPGGLESKPGPVQGVMPAQPIQSAVLRGEDPLAAPKPAVPLPPLPVAVSASTGSPAPASLPKTLPVSATGGTKP